MRRLIREDNPPAGQLASPVPQYWNPNTEAFEDVLGAHGAPRAILYGPNGQPIGTQTNPLEVRVRELEAKLEALKQTIESGVQLKGRSVEDGSPVEGPSYEVDPNGYAALRVVEAAPVAYDELADVLQVRVVYDNVMEELHSEVDANGIVTLNRYPTPGGEYAVPLSADVRAYSRIIVVVRWVSPAKSTIVAEWSLKGLSLAATDRVEADEEQRFNFVEFKNRTSMLRQILIRNYSDSPRTIHGIGVMGVR